MAPLRKVVLAGATGTVGGPVLTALLAAKYEVTVLTRPSSNHTFPESVKVAKVDYSDPSSLTEALKGHDVLVSTITITAADQQKHLFEAAIKVGIKRIIPSNFGGDLTNAKCQALPVFAPKVELERYIKEKTQGTETTYTFIYNNLFLNWDIEYGELFLVHPKQKKIELFDGGEHNVTTTPISMLAQGIVGVLKRPDETANREIRIQGIAISKKKLLELAQKVAGEEGWNVTDYKSEDVEKQAWTDLQTNAANFEPWVLGFLNAASWGKGYGNDFTGNHDNELLGLKELTEEDVEELIKNAAQ
jgi:uncharacterized protein YbjT (DUF2867 family)